MVWTFGRVTNVEFIRSPQSPPLAQYLVSSDWFHTSHIFPSTTVTLFFSPPRPPPPSHPPTHTSRPVRIDNGGLQHRIRVLGRAMPTSPLPPRGSQRQRGTTMHASALLPPPRQQGGGVSYVGMRRKAVEREWWSADLAY